MAHDARPPKYGASLVLALVEKEQADGTFAGSDVFTADGDDALIKRLTGEVSAVESPRAWHSHKPTPRRDALFATLPDDELVRQFEAGWAALIRPQAFAKPSGMRLPRTVPRHKIA